MSAASSLANRLANGTRAKLLRHMEASSSSSSSGSPGRPDQRRCPPLRQSLLAWAERAEPTPQVPPPVVVALAPFRPPAAGPSGFEKSWLETYHDAVLVGRARGRLLGHGSTRSRSARLSGVYGRWVAVGSGDGPTPRPLSLPLSSLLDWARWTRRLSSGTLERDRVANSRASRTRSRRRVGSRARSTDFELSPFSLKDSMHQVNQSTSLASSSPTAARPSLTCPRFSASFQPVEVCDAVSFQRSEQGEVDVQGWGRCRDLARARTSGAERSTRGSRGR